MRCVPRRSIGGRGWRVAMIKLGSLWAAELEETEHLAWTERRVRAVGGRKSLLNPIWYLGSYAIGFVAGGLVIAGVLVFLAETERQVEADSHLGRLPESDGKSRAIVEQMKFDERIMRNGGESRRARTARGGQGGHASRGARDDRTAYYF